MCGTSLEESKPYAELQPFHAIYLRLKLVPKLRKQNTAHMRLLQHESLMILAADSGNRMRPLTLYISRKPCLKSGGKPLIVWHIEKLKANWCHLKFIINSAWLKADCC